MESFDQAELTVKDILLIPINIGIKEINYELDQLGGDLILMVTGGQVIENYFPNSPTLRTHDFDLKLIAPKNVTITRSIRRYMLKIGVNIARNLETRMNLYVEPILDDLKKRLQAQHGVELITENGKTFYLEKVGSSLYTIMFKMKQGNRIKESPLIDVFVVKPDDIYHFNKFTGLQDSDPILSEDTGKYYIPYDLVNGVPNAGLGYILWDTIRMIEYTRELGLPKFQRYVNKRNAIIQGLNEPKQKLSCDMMQGYVERCNRDYKSACVINNKKYNNMDDLITLAIEEGIVPNDPRVIKRIRKEFSLNFLCEKIEKIL